MMAIIALPVYLTGEPAEEAVEKLPGVSEAMIELHEEAATIAIWLMGLTGAACLLALFFAWKKSKTARTIFNIAAVLSVICFAAMVRTGYYGGQVRHTEIRPVATGIQQIGNSTSQGEGNKENEKDDDD
jgi:VIT1/CCC1 family predicted Fe2+/Mn2+ transporter